MPELTRRPDPHRPDCWLIYFGDVHVGTIAKSNSIPNAEPKWQWLCGFYPSSEPGEQRGGTKATFEKAREAFGAAWRVLSATSATGPRGNTPKRMIPNINFHPVGPQNSCT
jgi:hypothetical protein